VTTTEFPKMLPTIMVTAFLSTTLSTDAAVSADPCDNFHCHIEVVPAEYCTLPVKGPFDVNCWIPCRLDNCTKEIENGNTCLSYICEPEVSPTPTLEVPETTFQSTTLELPQMTFQTSTLTDYHPTSPSIISQSTTLIVPQLTTSSYAQNNLPHDPCDDYNCHIESVTADFCTLPEKGPYDIDCWIPCLIDNCTKVIEPGNTCLDYICIPKPGPIPPPVPPTPPGPIPPPGPVPPPIPRNHDGIVVVSTLGNNTFFNYI